MERDTDSIATEKERETQHPETEETPTQWESTNDWDQNEWLNDMNYHGWSANGWGESIPTTQPKGSFEKGGNPPIMEGNLKTDPGCKAYGDSDWDLKTNGRAVAKNMPLLRGYANYGDWETDDT